MLEEELQHKNISYVVRAGQPFWCHTAVNDLMAILKVMADPDNADSELLQTVLTHRDEGLVPGRKADYNRKGGLKLRASSVSLGCGIALWNLLHRSHNSPLVVYVL